MNSNKITLMQYILMIHGVQMGVGILTLPRELAEKSGTDGWIVILLSWFASTLASLIIVQVMKRSPDGTILDLLTRYFGKWTGKVFTALFAVYFALLAHVIFIREALFIQSWILPYTEVYVLIALLSVPSYFIVRKNITILARYSEFIFFLTLWTIIMYLLPLKFAEWYNLLPMVKEGWMPIFSTMKTAVFSFLGFETVFFLYPYLDKKEKASLGVVIANTLSLLFFLIIVIGTFVFFSPDEITIYREPTIEMLKVIETKFIERLEIVFFSFYIFVISAVVLPFMYIAVFSSSRLAGRQDHHRRHLACFLLLECVYVILVPPSFESNFSLQQMVEKAGWICAFVFPVCLWGYGWLHNVITRRAVK